MIDISKIDFFKSINKDYLYDSLTHTVNRKNIEEYVKYLIKNEIPFSYIFMDLDNFKNINDTLGHLVGDEVLERVSKSMIENVEDKAIVARYGGDEFVIIAPNLVDYDDLWLLCRKIALGIRGIDDIKDLPLALPAGMTTATLGAARFPQDSKEEKKLIEIADIALYRGKKKGKNCFIIYNPILHSNIQKDNKEIKLVMEQIIGYIYEQFSNAKHTPYENLLRVVKFVSNYYGIKLVTKLDKDNVFTILNNEDNSIIPSAIPKEYFKVDDNVVDDVRLFYHSSIKDSNPELDKLMREQNIHSLILLICKTNKQYYGHFRVDGRFERIWKQEEKVVFQTIANLYTLLCEIYDVKW